MVRMEKDDAVTIWVDTSGMGLHLMTSRCIGDISHSIPIQVPGRRVDEFLTALQTGAFAR